MTSNLLTPRWGLSQLQVKALFGLQQPVLLLQAFTNTFCKHLQTPFANTFCKHLQTPFANTFCSCLCWCRCRVACSCPCHCWCRCRVAYSCLAPVTVGVAAGSHLSAPVTVGVAAGLHDLALPHATLFAIHKPCLQPLLATNFVCRP